MQDSLKADHKEGIQIRKKKSHAFGTWLEVQGDKCSWLNLIHSSHLKLTPQPPNYCKNWSGTAFIYFCNERDKMKEKGRDWFNRNIEIMFHPHWTPLHSNGPNLFQLQGLRMHCSYILDQFLCSCMLICFLSSSSQKSHFHNWTFSAKLIKVYSPPNS